MAGTRRPDGAEAREAFIVGVVLGLAVGAMVGAFLVGL